MSVLEGVDPAAPVSHWAAWDFSRVAAVVGLLVYMVLLALVVPMHEPWFDEIHAWIIARESNPLNLMGRLAYEGQPGLWHLLLMLPAKTLPVEALNWISAAVASAGAYLLLRRSPFPALVKLILPFTYFLFYQYAVVARNYVLLPVVLFGVAVTYPRRHERPALFAGLLFLLANTGTHGFVVAGILLAIYVAEQLVRLRRLGERPSRPVVVSVLLLGISMLALAGALIPPADRSFARAGHLGPRSFLQGGGHILNNALAGNWIVFALAMGVSLWFFRRMRVLHLYLIPTLVLLAFMVFVYNAPWHQGVMFLVWVFALWVGAQRWSAGNRFDDYSRLAALGMLVVVCLFQINWTVRTVLRDREMPYSGSGDMAAYIKAKNLETKTIYAVHWASYAVNGYFDSNIYANYPPEGLNEGDISYWVWSDRNRPAESPEAIEAAKPDYVVFTVKDPGTEVPLMKGLVNYRKVAAFGNAVIWKGADLEPDIYLMLKRRLGR